MAEKMQFGPICSQQNYHYSQLVVAPNEMVGLYCYDYPMNDPPPHLSGLFDRQYQDLPSQAVYVVLGTSQYQDITTCQLGRSQYQEITTSQLGRSQYQEDPSSRNKYNPLHVNLIQKTYGTRMIRLLGSSSLQLVRRKKKNSSPCVYVLNNTSLEGISRRGPTVTANKCTKNRDARAKVLFF